MADQIINSVLFFKTRKTITDMFIYEYILLLNSELKYNIITYCSYHLLVDIETIRCNQKK